MSILHWTSGDTVIGEISPERAGLIEIRNAWGMAIWVLLQNIRIIKRPTKIGQEVILLNDVVRVFDWAMLARLG